MCYNRNILSRFSRKLFWTTKIYGTSQRLLEIAGTKTPNLLRLMLRLCHVVRAIENKITQNTLKKEELFFLKKRLFL